jgi:hypothetical protein
MKTSATRIFTLIFSISISACSSAVQHEKSDKDSDSTVSQPVMVGGAYLTCSVEAVAVESSNVGVGCSVSESERQYFRDKNVKVVLHKDGEQRELAYQPAFDMLDPDDRSWNILDLPKDAVDGSEIEIIFPDGSSSRSLVIGGDIVANESSCDQLKRFKEAYNRAEEIRLRVEEFRGVGNDELEKLDDSYFREQIAEQESQLETRIAEKANPDEIIARRNAIKMYRELLGDPKRIRSGLSNLSSEAESRVEVALKAFNEIRERTGKSCQ